MVARGVKVPPKRPARGKARVAAKSLLKPHTKRRAEDAPDTALPPRLTEAVAALEQFRAGLVHAGYEAALASYQQLGEAIRAAREISGSIPQRELAEDLIRIQAAGARIAQLLSGYCMAMVDIVAAARGEAVPDVHKQDPAAGAPAVADTPADETEPLLRQVQAALARFPRGLSAGALAAETGRERRALLAALEPHARAGRIVISMAAGREMIALAPGLR